MKLPFKESGALAAMSSANNRIASANFTQIEKKRKRCVRAVQETADKASLLSGESARLPRVTSSDSVGQSL